jgi:hypothetical protein
MKIICGIGNQVRLNPFGINTNLAYRVQNQTNIFPKKEFIVHFWV